jgi:chitinase
MAISTRFGFSIALPSSYNYLRGIDPYALQMHVDWFNSMTYDLHGVWDGELGRGVSPLCFSLLDMY